MKIDMNGEVVARMILDDQEIATAHGLKGTPSFIIGSETVTGAYPYTEFRRLSIVNSGTESECLARRDSVFPESPSGPILPEPGPGARHAIVACRTCAILALLGSA